MIAVLSLCGVAAGQGAVIRPPQPSYAKYGSQSRQMTVYENSQRKLNELELEKYRRFRREVRRDMPRVETKTYVVRDRNISQQVVIR